MLTTVVLTPLLCATAGGDFAAPELITAGDTTFEKIIYPTPVLQDIDLDGDRELVIGDLIGNLWSCDPLSAGEDAGWARMEAVTAANGKPIKLNNW